MEIPPMKKTDTLPATLSALLQEYLYCGGDSDGGAEGSKSGEGALPPQPAFSCCEAGDWSRALHQLPAMRRWEATYTCGGPAVLELVRCEMFRFAPFSGVNNDPFPSAAARLGGVTAENSRLS